MSDSKKLEPFGQPRLRDALERVRPELALLKRRGLIPLNVEPLAAAATVRAALPGLKTLRPSIRKHLSTFEPQNLDSLETYSLALIYSHSLYLCAKAPPEHFGALIAEATDLRALLLSDVSVLVNRGHIYKGGKLKELGKHTGYLNIARDVLALSSLIRNNWEVISTKCGVTSNELDRAEVLGDQIVQLLGVRDQAPAMVAEAALERLKVYTLFARAYDQVRKAVIYLRWERGDAEKIAPSLYGGRKSTRKKATSPIEARSENAEQSPIATPTRSDVETPESTATKTTVAGLPGSDPFLH